MFQLSHIINLLDFVYTIVTICGKQKEGKQFKYTHSIDIFNYEDIWIYIHTYVYM